MTASAAQHQAAALSRHPLAKTVIVQAFAVGWLVRSLHATPTLKSLTRLLYYVRGRGSQGNCAKRGVGEKGVAGEEIRA